MYAAACQHVLNHMWHCAVGEFSVVHSSVRKGLRVVFVMRHFLARVATCSRELNTFNSKTASVFLRDSPIPLVEQSLVVCFWCLTVWVVIAVQTAHSCVMMDVQ